VLGTQRNQDSAVPKDLLPGAETPDVQREEGPSFRSLASFSSSLQESVFHPPSPVPPQESRDLTSHGGTYPKRKGKNTGSDKECEL
jgi:hypothetical protein